MNPEHVFIGNCQGAQGPGNGHQQPQAQKEHTAQVDQNQQQPKAKNLKKVLVHGLAAQFHGLPEIQAPINDQPGGENVSGYEVQSRYDEQNEAYCNKNRRDDTV